MNHKALEILHLQGRKIMDQRAESCLPLQFYQIICKMPFDNEEVMNWENQTFFFREPLRLFGSIPESFRD